MTEPLGRLERIELRDIWKTEDKDFTPWLAEECNLIELSKAIGVELELEAQEKDVGPFRADILCKSRDDETWVLIENQLERTDHTHLGQLLTYAAGLQAVTIVWVAKKFTDEHRAALDWLNKITDEGFRFFGLEVEVWRIGASHPAPKFNVVCNPNNWSRSVAHAAQHITEQPKTEAEKHRLNYWESFFQHIEASNSNSRKRKPTFKAYCPFPIGRSGIHFGALMNNNNNRIGVELCITDRQHAASFFSSLKADKIDIEAEVGEALEWEQIEGRTSTKILLFKDVDTKDEDDWSNQHAWLKAKLETFEKVFRQRVRDLDYKDWSVGEGDQ